MLTILPPSVSRLSIQCMDPQHLKTLWASTAYCRDSFTSRYPSSLTQHLQFVSIKFRDSVCKETALEGTFLGQPNIHLRRDNKRVSGLYGQKVV
jgi:lipopolysaccharide biosynthesis protein